MGTLHKDDSITGNCWQQLYFTGILSSSCSLSNCHLLNWMLITADEENESSCHDQPHHLAIPQSLCVLYVCSIWANEVTNDCCWWYLPAAPHRLARNRFASRLDAGHFSDWKLLYLVQMSPCHSTALSQRYNQQALLQELAVEVLTATDLLHRH